MQNRKPNLREMIPHQEILHIMGDVHVLMQAGQTYHSKKSELDIFGNPLYHNSRVTPRYNIFNADFDRSITDVHIDGNNIVIRTTKIGPLLRLKVQRGHIFSTSMDFTQEGDDEHQGSRDFLITSEPQRIAHDLILLENVVEVSFEELWEEAHIHTEMQHYQFRQHNGSFVSRPVPVSYKIIDTVEVENQNSLAPRSNREAETHERFFWDDDDDDDDDDEGFFSAVGNFINDTIVKPIVAVFKFGKSVIEFIDSITDVGFLAGDSVYSFNYNPLTRSRIAEILIFDKTFGKELAEGSSTSNIGPNKANSTASVEISISVTVTCTDCWGRATFRSSSRYEYTMDKDLIVIARVDIDVDLKAVIQIEAALALSAEAKIPFLAPDPTPKVSTMAVSGKTSSFKFNAGVYLTLKAGIEAKCTITVDNEVSLKGFIEFKTGPSGVDFDSDISIADSDFDVDFEGSVTLSASANFGPDVSLEIYSFKFAAFAGVALESKFALDLECEYKFKGETAQFRAYASITLNIPNPVVTVLNLLGADISNSNSKSYDFYKYEIKPLLGCLGEKDPKSDKGLGTLPVPTCTAVYDGHIYDFNSLTIEGDNSYSIDDFKFNICAAVKGAECSDSAGVCYLSHNVGKFTHEFEVVNRDTFVLHYRNGESDGCNGQGAQTDIHITCDRDAVTPVVVSGENLQGKCKNRINMRSAKACYKPCEVYVGETKYDLSPLKKPDGQSYSFPYKDGTFDVNICAPLSTTGCEGKGLCYRKGGNVDATGTVDDFVIANKINGFTFNYPSDCSLHKVELVCNKTATTAFISAVYETAPNGHFSCVQYTLILQTNLACPGNCQIISGSSIFDFQSLTKTGSSINDYYNIAKSPYGYDFNICGPLSDSKCTQGVGVCQITDREDVTSDLGMWNADIQYVSKNTFGLRYAGGSKITDIILQCSESASKLEIESVSEPETGRYEIKVKTDKACDSKAISYHATAKNVENIYEMESGTWELLPQSQTGIYTVRFDVSKIVSSAENEWFSILIFGSGLELISLQADGYDDFIDYDTYGSYYYVYEDYFDYLLFEDFAYADVLTSLVNEMEYITLQFSAANTPEIFSYIFGFDTIEPHGIISSVHVPEDILYSSYIHTPTTHFYYYCSCESGDPQVYISTLDSDTIAEGLLSGTTDYNFVFYPDSEPDTVLFFDVYSGNDDAIINLECILHPVILGAPFISGHPSLAEVLYQIPVDPEVNEIHIKSARNNALIDFYFITTGSQIIEEEPNLSSVGEILLFPQQMNRTDLSYAIVHGECSDLEIKAIKYLIRDEPVTNRIRVNEFGEILDIPFTYRYTLSPDFNENSFVHLTIISQFMERINITLSNGSYYNCSNAIDGYCGIEMPASEFTGATAEFIIFIQDPFESTVTDILVVLSEIVHVDDFDTIEGLGAIEDVEYLFTVPDSFNQFGVLFETQAENDDFEFIAYNRRTTEVFGANNLVPNFGLTAFPGDIFELQVSASSGTYSFTISPMDEPRVYMTSNDQSLLAFERGTFQLSLHIDSPGFFMADRNIETAAAITAFAYADDSLWEAVVIDIFNSTIEERISYIPFGTNEISVSTPTKFTTPLDSNDRQLCISFSPPYTAVVPYADVLAAPLCFTCPANSCGVHCGDCEVGDCVNNVCQGGEIEPPTVVEVFVPTPVYTPVATPVATPVYTIVYVEIDESKSSSSSSSSGGESCFIIPLAAILCFIICLL
eukprot:CAMPEP_0117014420 /NCGR_PEP_ID=MMETSP0472-20121206/11701_1 /TAXON_ID=693140 ORGANISM="Tiarina fusus, Strain LIS" /NCGR_SAMPLE_ID=MMETSP0472 /ASSEMBLY_ACC=CAM_ASM_000603 /LENGTH=1722 /DNA_ID=CAMNT_0004717973 /DNA_START=99 /DNA_END=5267 /DNA_ORIENTATION=+